VVSFDEITWIKIALLLSTFKFSVYDFARELKYDVDKIPYEKRGYVIFAEELANVYKFLALGQARYVQILMLLLGFVSVLMSLDI
jgi:hypothetical protein